MSESLTLDPRRTALLVMDYQAGIVVQMPNFEPLLDRVITAIDDFRGHGALVGWVRVAFTDDDFSAIPETSTFARLNTADRRQQMHADSEHTQIHSRLAPLPGDVIVRKTRVGAFQTTDLDQQLRARGISTLVLAGLSTSGVTLSTVREAMDRDYRIIVLADACADPDPETHRFLTETLFPSHARVVTVSDLGALWA